MRRGLGLPERQLKMLMKIRSARLYFLGNLIYFSCTTVSLTPVFQALGRSQLCVSALGLAWPRSDSRSPARAGCYVLPRSTCAVPAIACSEGRGQGGTGDQWSLMRCCLQTRAGDPWYGPGPPALGMALIPQNEGLGAELTP